MSFKKNNELEEILSKLNNLLAPVEKYEMGKVGEPEYPNLFLIGCPRCGSTMFTQWAGSLDMFSYPSNFLSRFFKAPYIGAIIYNIVTKPEYQYRNEFIDVNNDLSTSSAIGKTKGFKAPHEFWYFWREFMDFPDVPFSETEFAKKFKFRDLEKELTLLQKEFGKPFLCKAKIVNWYLGSMGTFFNHALYIHMYREPIATARSLLNAREKWVGSQEKWFSWKPREYYTLKEMDKFHQTAGQIYFIEKEILGKKDSLGNTYLSVSYEELCNDPEKVYLKICNKIKEFSPNYEILDYQGDKQFEISNPISDDDYQIKEAFNYFEEEYGKLIYD